MKIERFDIVVGVAIIALLLGIGATLLAGDRAGVGVSAFSPAGTAHTRSAVRIAFAEAMDTASVEAALKIEPATSGRIDWIRHQLIFTPDRYWQPGQVYTIRLEPGAVSLAGRRVIGEVRWQFRAEAPRVVYLAPAVPTEETSAANLWLVDPAEPSRQTQLTRHALGVENFATSPDGTHIAYATPDMDGTVDLVLLNVETLETRRLTRCIQARCQYPAWSPDSTRIAYQRTEISPALSEEERNSPRTWIVNVRDLSTAPLFRESAYLGGTPRWSPDGTKLAVYNRTAGAIVIVDVATGDQRPLDTPEGITGAYSFDPGSTLLVYPVLIALQGSFTKEFWLANLERREIASLSGADSPPVTDTSAAWNPIDGTLTVARAYLDGRAGPDAQVYRIDVTDPTTPVVTPLIVDRAFYHSALGWSPTSDQLVMMRGLASTSQPVPGIWVYDQTRKQIWQVAENGFLPQWLP